MKDSQSGGGQYRGGGGQFEAGSGATDGNADCKSRGGMDCSSGSHVRGPHSRMDGRWRLRLDLHTSIPDHRASPPLVGMLSTAGTVGHNIFDPGPLLFWLLAIPVRIDPAHGALWGAALLGGAAMSVAVEAILVDRTVAGMRHHRILCP